MNRSQKIHKHFTICFLLLIGTQRCWAAISYFGGLDAIGASGTVLAPPAESTDMLTMSIGAYGGIRLKKTCLIGVRSSYSMVEQTSEPTDSSGNRRGTWFVPMSPIFGWERKKWIFMSEVILLGDYRLALGDPSRQDVTYQSPFGFGVEVLYRWRENLIFGAKYLNVHFSKEQIGSGAPATLDEKLNLTSYGGVLALHF